GANSAEQRVVAVAAKNLVVAREAADDVVAAITGQHVVGIAAVEVLERAVAGDVGKTVRKVAGNDSRERDLVGVADIVRPGLKIDGDAVVGALVGEQVLSPIIQQPPAVDRGAVAPGVDDIVAVAAQND